MYSRSFAWSFFLLGCLVLNASAGLYGPALPDSGIVSRELDSFYDAKIDYSVFPARVTDKDRVGSILKIRHVNVSLSQMFSSSE